MAKYIGGPQDGKTIEREYLEDERFKDYIAFTEGTVGDDKPAYVYQRVQGSDDYQILREFPDFDAFEAWCIANVDIPY